MSKKLSAPSSFWHVHHLCGHAVYWSDPGVAMRTSAAPCPWCGGEDGNRVPKDVGMLHDRKIGLLAFREKNPDGTIPWPSEFEDIPDGMKIQHMADDSCCTTIKLVPGSRPN